MATSKKQKLAEAAARNPVFAKPPAKPAVITVNQPAKAPAPKGKK